MFIGLRLNKLVELTELVKHLVYIIIIDIVNKIRIKLCFYK